MDSFPVFMSFPPTLNAARLEGGKSPYFAAYEWMAALRLEISVFVVVTKARRRAALSVGMWIAASNAMIEMTISISMRVKAFFLCELIVHPSP